MLKLPPRVIFFTLVAAFVPFTVGGNIPRSVGLLGGVLLLMWLEWWLLTLFATTSNHVFPLVLSIEEKPERALAEINDGERISRAALEEVRQAIHGNHAGVHAEGATGA